jgi:hypothetical protein
VSLELIILGILCGLLQLEFFLYQQHQQLLFLLPLGILFVLLLFLATPIESRGGGRGRCSWSCGHRVGVISPEGEGVQQQEKEGKMNMMYPLHKKEYLKSFLSPDEILRTPSSHRRGEIEFAEVMEISNQDPVTAGPMSAPQSEKSPVKGTTTGTGLRVGVEGEDVSSMKLESVETPMKDSPFVKRQEKEPRQVELMQGQEKEEEGQEEQRQQEKSSKLLSESALSPPKSSSNPSEEMKGEVQREVIRQLSSLLKSMNLSDAIANQQGLITSNSNSPTRLPPLLGASSPLLKELPGGGGSNVTHTDIKYALARLERKDKNQQQAAATGGAGGTGARTKRTPRRRVLIPYDNDFLDSEEEGEGGMASGRRRGGQWQGQQEEEEVEFLAISPSTSYIIPSVNDFLDQASRGRKLRGPIAKKKSSRGLDKGQDKGQRQHDDDESKENDQEAPSPSLSSQRARRIQKERSAGGWGSGEGGGGSQDSAEDFFQESASLEEIPFLEANSPVRPAATQGGSVVGAGQQRQKLTEFEHSRSEYSPLEKSKNPKLLTASMSEQLSINEQHLQQHQATLMSATHALAIPAVAPVPPTVTASVPVPRHQVRHSEVLRFVKSEDDSEDFLNQISRTRGQSGASSHTPRPQQQEQQEEEQEDQRSDPDGGEEREGSAIIARERRQEGGQEEGGS